MAASSTPPPISSSRAGWVTSSCSKLMTLMPRPISPHRRSGCSLCGNRSKSTDPSLPFQHHEADKHVSQQRRITMHERVISLSQQGYNQGEIATELGMSRKKVRQLLQGPPHPPVYKSRPTKLMPYMSYLKHRFTEEACDNSLQLYREIRTLGSDGCRSVVTNYVTQLRKPSRGESDDRKKAKQATQTAQGHHSCTWPTAVVLPSPCRAPQEETASTTRPALSERNKLCRPPSPCSGFRSLA